MKNAKLRAVYHTVQLLDRMKVAVALLALFAASTYAQLGSRITLETMDVEGMLRNQKLVRKQIDCVLERGRCDINGRDLKGNYTIRKNDYEQLFISFYISAFLPEAIGDDCEDCSPRVKYNVDRVINYMRVNHPAEWAEIHEKYSR